ncbi:MAG: thiol-disulfide isomerase/thioredoxin [Planctomycetota bacterium]
MASSVENKKAEDFESQSVGNAGYLNRHNTQMFQEGRSFSGNERDKLWIGAGDASFVDLSDLSGADSANDGRAVIAADLDDDGDVDLFVHELQRERHALYRNDLNSSYGKFLKLRLRATSAHYEAIGASVRVIAAGHSTAQVLSRGSGYGSCSPPELVFGLGLKTEQSVTAIVNWPGGAEERFEGLAPNSRMLLVEGAGAGVAFAAHTRSLPNPLPTGLRVKVGQKIPSFRALDADGEEVDVDLAKLGGGRPVYLNLWASYCVPCIKELPDLQKIHSSGEYAVVGISMDSPLELERAQAMFKKRGAKFPSFYAGADAQGDGASVSTLLDLERLPIPTTLVLSPEGVLLSIIRGPIESE